MCLKCQKNASGVFSAFFVKFQRDVCSRENWKLKAVYFFLLSGIVMVWVQLTVHQSTLNFTDRDTSDFVSMSTPVTMFTPFLTGMVADKIGNFSSFVATLIILLGMNTFFFTLIRPIKMEHQSCNDTRLQPLQDIAEATLDGNHSLVEEKIKYCFRGIEELKVDSTDHMKDSIVQSFSCKELSDLKDFFIHDYVLNRTSTMDSCRTSNKTKDAISYRTTYWTYFLIYTCFSLLAGSCFALFDSTVMALQQEREVDYGLQRAWGTLAAMISAYLGGLLVDAYSSGLPTKDFTLMFFASGACFIICGLIAFSIDIAFKLPSTNYTKDLWKDLRNIEMLALVLIIIFKGIFMTYSETFMYLFMLNIGASSSIIGLTVTVGASFEVFLQLLATPVTKIFGKVAVISVGILCYSIRFIGFSYVYNPVYILYLEAFDSWASGFTITAITMYITVLASPETIASMRGLISLLHDGIGRLLGAKIGIEIKDRFGDRISWRVMSIWALSVAIIYYVTMMTFKTLRKRKLSRNITSATMYEVENKANYRVSEKGERDDRKPANGYDNLAF